MAVRRRWFIAGVLAPSVLTLFGWALTVWFIKALADLDDVANLGDMMDDDMPALDWDAIDEWLSQS